MKTKIYSHNNLAPKSRKYIMAAILTVLVLLGTGFATYRVRHNYSLTKTENGATPEEKHVTEQHKQELANQQNTQLPDSPDKNADNNSTLTYRQTVSGKKSVTVTISYAGPAGINEYVINALISGVIEAGGTCTVTASRPGANTVTKSASAVDNVSNTNCAPITFASSELSTGDWSLKVTYTSPTSEGSITSNLSVKAQ